VAETTRRVVTMDGAGKIAVQSEPIPPLKDNTVLVEVKSCLVSPGTELQEAQRRRKNPTDKPGKPFGYGNAGLVLEVGKGVEGISPGDKLACMGGGYAVHGSHAVVPKNLTVPIPEGLSFEEAAFAHLAATGLHAVRRAKLEFGQHVAVWGLGIVGQTTAQFARLSGTHVMAIDLVDERVKTAAKCGAHLPVNAREEDPVKLCDAFTRGYGLDVAFLAFGGNVAPAVDQARQMLKTAPDGHKMGVIVIVGWAMFEAEFPTRFGNVDIRPSSRPGPGYHDEAWEHGANYPPVFVEWTTRRNMEECLRSAAEGQLDVKSLITHRIPLEEAPGACDELINSPGTAMGVILNP